MGAVFLAIGASLLAVAWLGQGQLGMALIFGAIGLAFLAGGSAIGIAASGDLLAAARIGPARFDVRPETLAAGEQARPRLELCPRYGAQVRSVTFILVGERRVARRVGSKSYLAIERLAEVSAEASGPTELRPGEPRAFEASLAVPDGVPASARAAGKTGVFWYVEARVPLRLWPEWRSRQAVQLVAVDARKPEQATRKE